MRRYAGGARLGRSLLGVRHREIAHTFDMPFEFVAALHWPHACRCAGHDHIAGELGQTQAALGRPLADFTALNEDLEHMLALLAVIDDYVGVSNTNMRLRAAVGKTARVLIPCPAEWRWMATGTSPWFPDFSVYRQNVNGEWDAALAALHHDMAPMVSSEQCSSVGVRHNQRN